MESADSSKRPRPRQQKTLLIFFAPTPNKKRCTTTATESSDIQADITMINADHQERALESALDQPTSVGLSCCHRQAPLRRKKVKRSVST